VRTTQEIIDDHGWDRGVCFGHGDYSDAPKRVTPELISAVRREALLWAAEQIANTSRLDWAREVILDRAKSV